MNNINEIELRTHALRLVDKYLKSRGETFVGRYEYKAELIMPMVLMSLAYEIMQTELYTLKLKHSAKRSLNLWKDSMKRFNTEFFRLYNEDEQLQLVDLTEIFSDFIKNELNNFQKAHQQSFPSVTEEDRCVLSNILICNTITQVALITHHQFYSKKRSNIHIEACRGCSETFFEEYSNFINLSSNDIASSKEVKDQVTNCMLNFKDRCIEFNNTYLNLEIHE